MSEIFERFQSIKDFIGFGAQDVANLLELGPVFARRGPEITDRFYARLAEIPETAAFIEGRVERLKETHTRWMAGLFAGEYGQDYLAERLRIGAAHVRVGLDPVWVEGVMTTLRGDGLVAIAAEVPDPERAGALGRSLVRILDLDLFIIGHAYAAERLQRLSRFTGMTPRLIENAIRIGGRVS